MGIHRPLGISTSLFRPVLGPDMEPEGIRALQPTAINHIEYFCDDNTRAYASGEHIDAVKQAAADCGITVWSCHAPFGATDISRVEEGERRMSVGNVIQAFDVAVELSAGRVVVHGSQEPISDEDRPHRLKQCIRSLSELCPEASDRGIALALELLPRTCLANRTAEVQMIIEATDGDLRICYDANHITLYEGARESLNALGDRVETLHISDHDGIDERHWVPGGGVVDWPDFMLGLEDIGYSGCLMHEARDADLELPDILNAIEEAARTHLGWSERPSE